MSSRLARVTRLAAFTATITLAGACSEPSSETTNRVQPGMSRDSALAVLAGAPGVTAPSPDETAVDSMKNVWRRTAYLVDGQYIEVLWYSEDAERWTAQDTVPKGRVIPVVLVDGKVVGTGRAAYDQVAERYRLPKNRY